MKVAGFGTSREAARSTAAYSSSELMWGRGIREIDRCVYSTLCGLWAVDGVRERGVACGRCSVMSRGK